MDGCGVVASWALCVGCGTVVGSVELASRVTAAVLISRCWWPAVCQASHVKPWLAIRTQVAPPYARSAASGRFDQPHASSAVPPARDRHAPVCSSAASHCEYRSLHDTGHRGRITRVPAHRGVPGCRSLSASDRCRAAPNHRPAAGSFRACHTTHQWLHRDAAEWQRRR